MERTITILGTIDNCKKAESLISAKLRASYESDMSQFMLSIVRNAPSLSLSLSPSLSLPLSLSPSLSLSLSPSPFLFLMHYFPLILSLSLYFPRTIPPLTHLPSPPLQPTPSPNPPSSILSLSRPHPLPSEPSKTIVRNTLGSLHSTAQLVHLK